MKTHLSLVAAAALLAPLSTTHRAGHESRQDSPKKPVAKTAPIKMQVHQIDDVMAKHRASKRSYTPFFKVPSLRTRLYSLRKGARDGQSPHTQDELYYVLTGKAKMQCDGRREPVRKGSLVFIAAGTPHRYVDIEEALEPLGFFSSGPRQGQIEKRRVPSKK